MPNARLMEEGSMRIGYSNSYPYEYTYISATPFSWLEASYKYTEEKNELYGSVKPTEVSKIILENTKININPSLIQLMNEIKALGKFKVKINLHSEIQAEISIDVVAAESVH